MPAIPYKGQRLDDDDEVEDRKKAPLKGNLEKTEEIVGTLGCLESDTCVRSGENINYQVHYENADIEQAPTSDDKERCILHCSKVRRMDRHGRVRYFYADEVDEKFKYEEDYEYRWYDLTPKKARVCFYGTMGIVLTYFTVIALMYFSGWGVNVSRGKDLTLNATEEPVIDVQTKEGIHYHDHNNLSAKNRKKAKPTSISCPAHKNCTNLPDRKRFDCYPQNGANEQGCIDRGCCWKAPNTKDGNIPYCFYPPDYRMFNFVNMTENKHGLKIYYKKCRPSGYPDDFEMVAIHFKYMSDDVLQVKITDAEKPRFEAPYPEIPIIPGSTNNMKYKVITKTKSIGFKVVRTADNVTIWDTNVGGLVLSNRFLQISTLLPSGKVYGLGERRSRFLLDNNWKTYTIFNNDVAPVENVNLYGSHPFYLGLEDNGKSHGVVLLNPHLIDVVLQPTPAMTYRTISGVFNFLIFLGPTPSEVVAQYTSLIGRTFMPPYWSLGFHLCKFDYGSLQATKDVWQRTREAGIPYDVQWNDLDYMNNSNMFTYDHDKFAGLPQFVDQLHNVGMHYIPLVDPGVSASEVPGSYPPFERGLVLDIFVKNDSAQPFVGKVWNKGSTVWPDFTHPNATTYWVEMLKSYHKLVNFDGAWTDMNEPSNFLSGPIYGKCKDTQFPYLPSNLGPSGLNTKTICMDAMHYAGLHIHWHNLYSLMEIITTNFALTEIRGKRPFIISRASFVGLGHYAGHWSGDIASEWHDMQMTVPELLSFSIFGVPMMGADICGFRGNSSPQLCKRWMQLGAFYPFARNHNSDTSTPQDPVSLGEEVVIASRNALRLRYSLLPYMYTLFFKANQFGETVIRPMFFEFPSDVNTHAIDDQFMIGPHILIAPILKEGANTTAPYLTANDKWFNIRNGVRVMPNTAVDENSTVLVKSGAILVQQEPPPNGPVTTNNTRSQPMQLLVVLTDSQPAEGTLYWDDGDTLHNIEERRYTLIDFKLDNSTTLSSHIQWWGYGVPYLNQIKLYNLKTNVTLIKLNDKNCQPPFCSFVTDGNVMTVNVNLNLEKEFFMTWVYEMKGITKEGVTETLMFP